MSRYQSDPDDAPTPNDLAVEAQADKYTPLPTWFRKPLTITPPYRGSQSAACTEHLGFHAHGDRDHVVHHAFQHVATVHGGRPPTPVMTDPWQTPDPDWEVPF